MNFKPGSRDEAEMNCRPDSLEARLRASLARYDDLTIAVSGGVDSMTLAFAAHRRAPEKTRMFHAVSPAVPKAATERVRLHAARHGWRLAVGDAGEFASRRYRENPVDRCYFCKSSLYGHIRAMTEGTIASGANLDDLGDYRPGLRAAAERQVVHPLIEAGFAKADVRVLARHYGLDDLAELPAQPCLSSRIVTGIAISGEDLAFVEMAEAELSALLPRSATLRCRVTRAGIVIEMEPADLGNAGLRACVQRLCDGAGRSFAGVRGYERGSAFQGKPGTHG